MKTSFTTMATPGMQLDEILSAAREYNFDAVDLRVHEDGEVLSSITNEEAKVILEKAGDTELYSLLCYGNNIHNGKEKLEETILSAIAVAEKLNSKAVRIFPGKIKEEKNLDDMCDVLNSVFEKYKGNVNVFLQNHRMLGVTCENAVEIGKRIKDERYGFIFSPDQSFLNEEDYIPLLPEITKITKQIYIADMTEDKKFCLIGEGILPFTEIMDKMCECGFDGYLTLKWEKCWHDYLPEYDKAFESFMKYFKKYI